MIEFFEDFISLFAVIVFWTGGYLAAPLLFMATLGVFKNLAGVSSGSLKMLRGKITEPGKKQRAIGREPREQFKQQKRSMIAAKRRGWVEEKRDQTTGRVNRAARSKLNDAGVSVEEENPYASFKRTYYETRRAELDPKTQAGKLREAASNTQTNAAATEVANQISNYIDEALEKGTEDDQADARTLALDRVLANITAKLDAGTATQADVNGTALALGTQQAGGHLNDFFDHIGTMGTGENAQKAQRLYGGMLGNSAVYQSVTAQSPGLKAGLKLHDMTPSAGQTVDERRDEVKKELAAARAEVNLKESAAKVAGMSKEAWKEMFEHDRDRALKLHTEVVSLQGEPASKLKISADQAADLYRSAPPPTP